MIQAKRLLAVLPGLVILTLSGCALKPRAPEPAFGLAPGELWKAIVFAPQSTNKLEEFRRLAEDALAPAGVNIVIFDMHWWCYRFRCRPEFDALEWPEDRSMSHEEARAMAAIARENGMRVMTGMNCLTHQMHGALLKAFPQFAEPGTTNTWCPLHPDVNAVVYDVIDELLDAFEADAFHVGMDEAWDFQRPECQRCTGQDPAKLFAKAVTDMYDHIVKRRGVEMLMWGDMLLGWHNKGTKPATDLIPKDIIVCDWHYNNAPVYPSIDFFLDKGFRVLPSGWRDPAASLALVEDSLRDVRPGMLGHLYTTWSGTILQDLRPALLGETDADGIKPPVDGIAAAMKATLPRLEPVARARIEFLTEPEKGYTGFGFLEDANLELGGVTIRQTAFPEGNFGLPVAWTSQQLTLENLDGQENLGGTMDPLKARSGEPAERLWGLGTLEPGRYRFVIDGVAKVPGLRPKKREFRVYGREFTILDRNWRDKTLRETISSKDLDAARPYLAEPPSGGRLLFTLDDEALDSKITQQGDQWLHDFYPSWDPWAFAIVFPANTPSTPGDFCRIEGPVSVPDFQNRLVMQIFLADHFHMTEWTGYRFYEALINDAVVWSEDILEDRKGRHWVEVDITDAVRGQDVVNIAVQVIDRKGVGNYGSASLVGPVRFVDKP